MSSELTAEQKEMSEIISKSFTQMITVLDSVKQKIKENPKATRLAVESFDVLVKHINDEFGKRMAHTYMDKFHPKPKRTEV